MRTTLNKWAEVRSIPLATTAMHPAQSWRDGYNDGVRGQAEGTTQNGYRTVRGDSASELYYFDGYNCGSIKYREVQRRLGLIS